MNRIYHYELRRILRSKFFWGLLAVCLFFGWNILQTATIQGVAHTAPFSPWSFGAYLARILPLLGLALLFFQWNQCNERSRQVGRLTDAAPVEQGKYLLVKCAAAVTALLLLAAILTALGMVFLLVMFRSNVPVGMLLLTAVITLFPALLFLTGIGLIAGRVHSGLLFGLMALALGAGFVPLPMNMELYGYTFFTEYPLALGLQDPAFSMPGGMILSRIIFLLAGGGLLVLAVWRKKS